MDKKYRILIVEDDPAMLRGLKDNFEFVGYDVEVATDGERGLEKAFDVNPDLIVLDIMLPIVNGYEICRLIRKEGLKVPIIMLTAKGQTSDVVLGLKTGADDYMTKPFSIKELLARVEAMLRRTERLGGQNETVCFGEYKLDCKAKELYRNAVRIDLTPKEYGMLEYFIKNSGRAVTRTQLLNAVWGYNVFVGERSVDRCVTTLREKIPGNEQKIPRITTVRAVGYRFDMAKD